MTPTTAPGAGLRTGWTTGTCASAAAKAAALELTTGAVPAAVDVGLPNGRRVTFPVERAPGGGCVVVKDAGDDPDCTDGARVTVHARIGAGATVLEAGPGVGIVTRPGLGLAPGSPAINPVPRRMILQALDEVVDHPLAVTFSVPGGEEMARRTSNSRLGIVGGISILGTTGIVRPFSTAAYRASVVQQIEVAAANGAETLVLSTGTRSDRVAMLLHPELPEVCFVEVGDYTGVALRRAAAAGVRRVVFVGMAGKITKLAAGVMMTHFRRSKVDGELLRRAADRARASAAVRRAATETATARHFFETCVAHGEVGPLLELCRQARAACIDHTGGYIDAQVLMVDFDGREVIARA